ncbi:hypothetical protein MTY81_12220 [Mycolicibacterium sp. TY81]|nr:hypothetical protein MTY81_12220 [Mycolicibacterium sp. TY81]
MLAPDWSPSWPKGVINLDERIKHTDADIEERFRRHPLAEVITSLPGIGFRLGAEFPCRGRRSRTAPIA